MKMSSHIKAIVFDFGAVLIEWEPRNIFREYFPDESSIDAFLKDIEFMKWNAEQDEGRSFSEGFSVLSKQFPQYAGMFQTLEKNWLEIWSRSVVGEIKGSVRLLHALNEQGYPLYGLSNWSTETFPVARERYNFFELFDDIVLSGEVKLIKPGSAIFELFLQRTNRSAQECLFIDDSSPNIVTAAKMGFDCIHFKSPEQLKKELHKRELL